MSKKQVTVRFVIGIFAGLFVIPPILSFLGVPSFDQVLVNVFGDNNPLVPIIALLIVVLVVMSVYKTPKK